MKPIRSACLLLFLLGPESALGQEAQRLVVLGENVACRVGPSLSADVVTRLDVANMVTATVRGASESDWREVRTPAGFPCFMSSPLLAPFDSAAPDEALIAIATYTLGLEPHTTPFDRMFVVYELFESNWQGVSVESSARLRLLELEILGRTGWSVYPRGGGRRPEIREWVARNEHRLLYYQTAGAYYVKQSVYWELYEEFPEDELSDDIAWAAALNVAPMHCEGDVGCALSSGAEGELEYLKRRPTGAHVPEALERLRESLTFWVQRSCDQRDWEWLVSELGTLRSTLGTFDHPAVADVQSALDAYDKPC